MRKVALLPILALALVACADQPGLVAPDGINPDLQPTSVGVWFVTDPPEPALVGDTYDVEARADGMSWGSLQVTSLTPGVCGLEQTWGGLNEWSGTVTFVAPGDCGLYATDGLNEAFQIFEVYEPNETPAPIMKTCAKTGHSKILEIRIPLDQPCPPGWD